MAVCKENSAYSTSLEVVWQYGKLILDSPNANYSFGSLQQVLRRGLFTIGKPRIQQLDNALILGVAGGSVIQTLRYEMGYTGKIVGVEIDPKVIELAVKYFNLDQINDLTIIIDDAQNYLKSTTATFDLIIIDIFTDNLMPGFLFSEVFYQNLEKCLQENGSIVFNTIVDDFYQVQRNSSFIDYFTASGYTTSRIANIEGNNELLFVK